MKYRAFALIEPGMDRPCLQHSPPSEAQRGRLLQTGGRAFIFDLDIPGVEFVDGVLQVSNVLQIPLRES